MRETGIFFLYLFGCLLLATLVAVPLVATGWIDEPPQRILGRLAQVFMLLGLWPLLRACGCANAAALGFAIGRRDLLRAVAWGWVIGVLMLGALALALVALEVRVPRPWSLALAVRVLERAGGALLAGLLIALLEELFFRGALFSAIRRRSGLATAAIGSAGLYALVHFLKPTALPAGVAFDWSGAAWMVGRVFTGFPGWQHLDSLLALFVAGLLLAQVRERTGHIGWGIGLHAGWVFVIAVTRGLTVDDTDATLGVLNGTYDGVIGWFAAAWVGALALAWWWLAPRHRDIRSASHLH